MKGWEKNVVLYAETHAAGACPVCGKNNVTVQEHIFGSRHSLTFRCRDCGAGDHFDGAIPQKEPNHG